ncbi:MAG TPA: inner membrane protein YpjD, partial [Tahibacter sp.]|nr:inner membrane protein YpjD [Tahibacter sp.]
MLIPVLSALACVLYVAAALALALPLVNRASLPRGASLGLATAAVVAHAAVVFGAHGGGLDLHFFAALSLVALLTAAMTLVVNMAR